MSILHLEHISYTYEKSETPVLRDITADFEAGKMYAVIGKSSDGKSIRLSLVSGLDVCREGAISYNGENLKCINRDKYRALNIGVVFQSYNLLLNVGDFDAENKTIYIQRQITSNPVKPKGERKIKTYEVIEKPPKRNCCRCK